jgi:hypothetical protein
MGINYSPKIVTDDLVLCLDAANPLSYPGSGNTWYDLSENGNNGTLVNGPTFSSSNAGSLLFDGSNDYANVSIPLTFSACTMMFYTKFNVVGVRWNMILDTFRVGSSHKFTFQANAPTATNMYIVKGAQLALIENNLVTNKWYCFGATYDGNTLTGYNAGIPTNSVSSTGTFDLSNTIGIAARNNGFYYQNAYFSYFLTYNMCLSSAQMLDNFNATKGRFGL